MVRILFLFTLTMLSALLSAQDLNPEVSSYPIKLATIDSVNLDYWNYNQRKVARMPWPVVMYETGDSIYYTINMGESWTSLKGKEATFAGGPLEMYIVFKEEFKHGYEIRENDTILKSHEDIVVHEVGQEGSTSIPHYFSDTSLHYSAPLADIDRWGDLHIIYGGKDTTEAGKPFIRSLFVNSNFGNPIYEMNDSTNRDTVVNYAIATNLIDWANEYYTAIAYQLSNDSIYLMYKKDNSAWQYESAFAGIEPSLSIGCGNHWSGINEYLAFPVIQYLDTDRNLYSRYFGDGYAMKSAFTAGSQRSEQHGPVEYACIDDVVGPLGHSYIFQKDFTLFHAFRHGYYTDYNIRDTIAHNVIAGSIAYKEFNLEKVDVVWLEEVDGKYEFYYQWFEKFPSVNSNISDHIKDALFSAYPNPFSSHITFRIQANITKAKIYSAEGRVLKSFNNVGCSGVCEFTWDGKAENGDQVEGGMYIVQFSNDKDVYTRKIVLVR